MERLTNKKEADAQRIAYQRRLAQGYPRNIPEERFLRLAAYEDTGLEPEEMPTGLELANVYAAMLLLKQYEGIGTVDGLRSLKEAEQKRRQGCEDCKSGFYMTNNVQHPQYKWCPKCGRDLRGESHD